MTVPWNEYEPLGEALAKQRDELRELRAENRQRRQKNQRYEDALRWYAEEAHYCPANEGLIAALVDGGACARAALEPQATSQQYHLTCQQCGSPFVSDCALTPRCQSCLVSDDE